MSEFEKKNTVKFIVLVGIYEDTFFLEFRKPVIVSKDTEMIDL